MSLALERPCLYRDVPAAEEPSTCAVWYSAWSLVQFTGKRYLRIGNLHLLPYQMHTGICQTLWMCCRWTWLKHCSKYQISEEYLSSLTKLPFLALKWATVALPTIWEQKERTSCKLVCFPPLLLKQKLLYCTTRKNRTWKQWMKLALLAVRNYHTVLKN